MSSSSRVRSARILQRFWRRSLNVRYANKIRNHGEDDYITSEPMRTVPRGLLFVTKERIGFHAAALLVWLCKSPVNPLTREAVPPDVVHACYQMVSAFVKTDSVLLGCRRGFYRKRALCRKAMRSYHRKLSRGGFR
jgi:hypothetical protein